MFFLVLACAQESLKDSVMLCNGSVELCDKRISEALFTGTHNSMSAQEEGWLGPNHIHPIPTQLSDGVRALNIDTYWWEGSLDWVLSIAASILALKALTGFFSIRKRI